MQLPDTYWGIQMPDGYIPVTEEQATAVIIQMGKEDRPVLMRITSLIGSRRFIVLDKVSEIFESTEENRDADREFKLKIDKERRLFKTLNSEFDSDD